LFHIETDWRIQLCKPYQIIRDLLSHPCFDVGQEGRMENKLCPLALIKSYLHGRNRPVYFTALLKAALPTTLIFACGATVP